MNVPIYHSTSDDNTRVLSEIQRLIDVIAKLRNPQDGCPWDLEQTPESLTQYVIEESYEVVDAINNGNKKDVEEELGDLLLQIVLQAQIFKERGDFDLGDIAKGITDKMIRRHPHVFATGTANTPEEVNANWEKIKAAEKADTEDPDKLSPKFERYARSMPPIAGAMKISRKAAKAGFEWENLEEVWGKVEEEIAELRYAIQSESKAEQEGELGDVFFSLIQIARWQKLDPTAALQGTNHRFVERFAGVEAQASKPLSEYSIEELEAFWQQAKQQLAQMQEAQ